ncbi:SDR family NAD(P)-dependent oxidoreductase [Noviherbaspirillum saxi]|uniref:SDR family NAD(P)-dependent oxidoreductase n=1 Tax=Noviherbaspirillum saxi TaxID=2320863 RepID=UPI0018F5DA20|nr:SDR family NAD(P)-dependent oxidoreductase [Noviherbaspirillum saxi]
MSNAALPLSGKHAVVTGGGRGIGAAIAASLLRQGARLTLLGRSETTLAETASRLEALGRIDYVCADVADADAVTHAFSKAESLGGTIDILINNAGQAVSAPFVKTDAQLWNRMLAVNLNGCFHCTQAVLPGMLRSGWGRIVNVASTAGLTGYGYVSAYCAAKHGVIGLTRALALELATKGITVNAVCPGYTDTDMTQETIANIVSKTARSAAEAQAELSMKNPQKRLVAPEEVANAVAWLCLPQSAAMNGQSITVAGGEVM